MPRTKLTVSVAAAACLLLASPILSQQPDDESDIRRQLAVAEHDVQMLTLELKIAELLVDEAKIEVEKTSLRVQVAEEEGNSREVGYVKLELKQAAVQVEMRRVQSEMARLRLERAKARLR